MNTPDRPTPLRAQDYDALEQALMESPQGRLFLSEYARRNRTADTQVLLEAIARLESALYRPHQNMDLIRRDLREMSEAIARTRVEIAAMRVRGARQSVDVPVSATEELDSIVMATERATSQILAAVEAIQETVMRLREESVRADICDRIEARLTDVVTACSFQDITGQRIQKIVQVLHFLEARLNSMIDIWEIDDGEIEEAAAAEDATAPPRLHGPQREGAALNQADIDSIIETLDEIEPMEERDPVRPGDDLALADGALADEDDIFAPVASAGEGNGTAQREEGGSEAQPPQSRLGTLRMPVQSFGELAPASRLALFL